MLEWLLVLLKVAILTATGMDQMKKMEDSRVEDSIMLDILSLEQGKMADTRHGSIASLVVRIRRLLWR